MVTLDTGQASDLWAGAREYWEEVVSCSVAERHPPGLQATLPTAAVLTQYHIMPHLRKFGTKINKNCNGLTSLVVMI